MTTTKRIRGVSASAWMAFAVIPALPMVASAQIEEVVVSTRRRAESLQDVPIAVSVLSSEQIERQGITDLKDVVQNQPSVQFDQSYGPADNRITIRGLSNTRGRSNVAFLVDGIDVTTETLISAGSGLLANRRLLSDVQSIEIVKGPQSALFGRSAFAGALSYTTKEPGDEFDGRVGLDVADFGRRTVEGAFGGPLSDTVGLRISGVQFNEDGFYTNSLTGNDVGGTDGYGAALTTVWKPVDAVKVKARVEYSDEHYDPRAVVRAQGDTPFYFPESAKAIVRPIITTANGSPVDQKNPSGATNLFNFGTYCPKFGFDPLNIQGEPGICLPGVLDSSSGDQVWLSENPLTGTDFPGTDAETFRASITASYDLGYGLISSNTGWTDFNSTDNYDQDYQASTKLDFNGNGGRPYTFIDGIADGRLDTMMGNQTSNQESITRQFSHEFRYETQLDGPVQFTGGVLFWQDKRTLYDRNYIDFCSPYSRVGPFEKLLDSNGNPTAVNDPTTGDLVFSDKVCSGLDLSGNPGGTETSWQDYRRQFSPDQYAATWEAQTRHLSFYARIDWNITDDLELSLENRWLDEEFNLTKPGASNCTEAAFASGGQPVARWVTKGDGVPYLLCDIQQIVEGTNVPLDASTELLTLRYIEGTTYSNYDTPKATLAWTATDNINLFFSWASAQKPGGINQLTGGGGAPPPALEDERFDSEKLEAWELGLKSSFEGAGFWNLNSSIFFQDYSQKQVGIQVVAESGVAQPRVVNVDGTEVWGLEFELLWQPAFMDGLRLGVAGTIQDAKYTKWVDDTRNLVKAAVYGDCPVIYKRGDLESTDPLDPIFELDDALDILPSPFCRLDYSGNELERAPKQAYTASMQIQRPFLDTPFEYLFELNGSWQDERWTEPENLTKLADYYLVDMRLGLTSDKWDVIAYVDNVLDQDTYITGGSGPDFAAQVTQLGFTAGFGTTHYFGVKPDPRVFGIRGSYRFGGGR